MQWFYSRVFFPLGYKCCLCFILFYCFIFSQILVIISFFFFHYFLLLSSMLIIFFFNLCFLFLLYDLIFCYILFLKFFVFIMFFFFSLFYLLALKQCFRCLCFDFSVHFFQFLSPLVKFILWVHKDWVIYRCK